MKFIEDRLPLEASIYKASVLGLALGAALALVSLGDAWVLDAERAEADATARTIQFASPSYEAFEPPADFIDDPRAQPYVAMWVARLTKSPPRVLNRYLASADPWKSQIVPILGDYAVPPEFVYLALLESGLDPEARSSAEAVGLWQFTQETAEQYGLVVDDEVDERHDVLRSTEAAGRYLRDLHRRFGSWELAAAAYNAGPNRVERALATTGYTSYWELVEVGYLPAETRDYVPRFLATVQLANARIAGSGFATFTASGAD